MLVFLTAVTASNDAQQGEGCYMFGPPGVGFSKPCAAGLQCVGNPEYPINDGYKTCEPANLGQSNVAQLGETCACADCGPADVPRPCATGLVCFNECAYEPGCEGGMSTCQYPELGSWHPARLGSSNPVLCPFKPPAIGSTICREHEVCVDHKCIPRIPERLGASNNRVACSVAPPEIGTWLCGEGEICVNHQCVSPILGASNNREACSVAPPAIGTWLCGEGEICVNHQCVSPILGSSNHREACSVAPPATGTWLCGEGEVCVNHQCVSPTRLGASLIGPAQQGEECACDACGPTPFRRECALGLQCVGNPLCVPPCVDDGYKTCEYVNLGSSNSRVVCTVPPPARGAWLCAEGETCVDHKCVQPSLGASNDNWTGCHGDYDCARGQECHLEVFGARVHGTCQ